MTREEAIRELREDKALYETDNCHAGDGSPDGDLLEALDMAIEALQREEAEEKGYCHNQTKGRKERAMDGWREQPITEKQKEYIRDMEEFSYYPLPKFTGTTKGEASDYIEKHRELAHENVNSPMFGY